MGNEIARWNPAEELRQMQRLMDRFWLAEPRLGFSDAELTSEGALPAVDIFEKDGNVVVKAALPGVKPEEIDVNVSDGVLYIRAETKAEEDVHEKDYHRKEYRYGKYARSFRLPDNLDASKATAKYENGMLRLIFPKTEATKPKPIKVSVV